MQYQFDSFVLDLDRGDLRHGHEVLSVESRVFTLLAYLVDNADRLITKDELVEKVWDGRHTSDAALSTLFKSARRVIGDDGKQQKYIRTVHGRGLRFVGTVRRLTGQVSVSEILEASASESNDTQYLPGEKLSIAVLPFNLIGEPGTLCAIADAVPAEIISSLSRLRWLSVVSRASTFRFRHTDIDPNTIRETLGANYCLTGNIEVFDNHLAIDIELLDTRSGHVIWAERLSGSVDDVHQIRVDIVNLIVSAMELHITLNEAEQARLRPPNSLDAWSYFHMGLQHMYRFNRTDNSMAAAFFHKALKLNPNFARAYATLSFTSFQNAFLKYNNDTTTEIENASRYAERCIELDPFDPLGNFTCGRAQWLRGDPEAGQAWIERAISLSPSFAQAFYAHGWADVMAGRGAEAQQQIDKSIELSPLDPFLYAMQSARALAYLHEGNLENAALWAVRGARKPGAHYLISAIAAGILQVAGQDENARYWLARTLERRPDTAIDRFFIAFPFEDMAVRQALHDAFLSLGLPENAPDGQ